MKDSVTLPINVIIDKIDLEFFVEIRYNISKEIPAKLYPIDKAHPKEGGEIENLELIFHPPFEEMKEEIIKTITDHTHNGCIYDIIRE